MQQALNTLSALGPAGYAAAACGFWALFFMAGWLLAGRKVSRLKSQLETARLDNEKLRTGPQKWEYRIERFDVLWFPTLTTAPATREVTQVSPGVPHCATCVRPLALSGKDGEWACPKCETKYAGSLADLSVMDIVNKQALKFFQERHPDYTPGRSVGRITKI